MISWYRVVFEIGRIAGCHQRSDRSFFVRGKQFPVCARCTGVFFGYLVGGILFWFYKIPFCFNIAFCAIMFADWLVQRLGWRESTNLRRLITGIVCGVGWIQLSLGALVFVRELLTKL